MFIKNNRKHVFLTHLALKGHVSFSDHLVFVVCSQLQKIFSSETAQPIFTDHLASVVRPQLQKFPLWNRSANFDQALVGWSLGGPL